jgi:biopolymer transport protein ExbD
MQSTGASGLNREPNVIPLLDILFVLLIIAILLAQQSVVEVQLPAPATSVSSDRPLVLSVTRGPTYTLNGTAIPPAELIPRLKEVYDPRPEKILFIDGARDVAYQDVAWVYGAVRSAGVTVTAILPPAARRSPSVPRP